MPSSNSHKYIDVRFNERLFELIAREADERGVPMNQVVVERMAASFGREDLSYVPHRKMGRPRKQPA